MRFSFIGKHLQGKKRKEKEARESMRLPNCKGLDSRVFLIQKSAPNPFQDWGRMIAALIKSLHYCIRSG